MAPDGARSPNAAISDFRNGRSHARSFPRSVHARHPRAVVDSVTPAYVSATRLTSRQVATVVFDPSSAATLQTRQRYTAPRIPSPATVRQALRDALSVASLLAAD